MASKVPPKLLEEQLLALEAAIREHGFWHGGGLCLTFAAVAEAVWPDVFRDTPVPGLALEVPGSTPERLQQLIERGEANQSLFPPADRDLERLQQLLAARAKLGRTRKDRRKHYEVVVESHHGLKVREQGTGERGKDGG